MTLHPDVSGRPQVLLMLERLISYWQSHSEAYFVTFEQAAAIVPPALPLRRPAAGLLGRDMTTAPLRIGMIVPSSNTAFEPAVADMHLPKS